MSASQDEKAAELVEAFEFFDDWENRYEYLIELGKKLPPYPSDLKTDANLVRGCQSQVWVTASAGEKNGVRVIDFNADSNSSITKGIVAILAGVYSGETPRDILHFDVDALMQKLELDQHLSPARRNGLSGMVTRIKSLAALNAEEKL